jgi:hypothetical protein
MDFVVVSETSLVSDADAQKIAQAICEQLISFCVDWHLARTICSWAAKNAAISPGNIAIRIRDLPDVEGAAGYHEEIDGIISALVFAQPLLDAGGGVLDGGKINDSVSAVVSHEVLESKKNPNTNLWADGPILVANDSFVSVAYECADPVQDGAYTASNGALVSNYVFPSWFDLENKTGPYDKMGVLKGPMTVTHGGYVLVRNAPGSETPVFGQVGDARPWRVRPRLAALTKKKSA